MAPILKDNLPNAGTPSAMDSLLINNKNNLYTNNVICLDCSDTDKEIALDVNKNEIEAKSQIQEFYSGKNVFVTGATGFLGKILIEKLLRCCPGVENLYLLVRQKRGKDIYTRIDEVFEDPVFERLKNEVPKFRHKIVPIQGDCNAAGLGLSLSDRQILTEKVNIIFHSAATVKFDEHLRTALVTNVRAPLHLLRLARDMRGLDVIIHVSTAYSNCHLPLIEEKFYSCEVDSEELDSRIRKLTDDEVEDMLPTIIRPWPNTYTFTKALAEKELRGNAENLPLGIFRPGIVTSTAKEPLESWIDNMYGPTGVAVGCATGVLRTLHCDPSVTADIVPVDLVVNCLIAVARHVHVCYKESTPPSEPPIFNYISSVENKITWGSFMEYNMDRIDENPLTSAIWYVSLTLTRSAFLNNIAMLFLHLLPAVIVDGLAVCVGQKPKMLKVYRKIHKFSSVISYFCTRNFHFCNKNTRELWQLTCDADRKLFPFSMSEITWSDYLATYLTGIRKYIFKESEDTLPKAKIKWRRLYYMHQIVRLVFIGLAIYTIWKIINTLNSLRYY